MKQTLSDECGECPRINTTAYPAPVNCTSREENGYCTFNGTQYARCELDGKILCYNLKVRYRNGQSETFAYNVPKKNANQAPVHTCDQCNRTVWVEGKKKSVFVAYFQVNQLYYDHTQLKMCVMRGKTYWVDKNLRYENR